MKTSFLLQPRAAAEGPLSWAIGVCHRTLKRAERRNRHENQTYPHHPAEPGGVQPPEGPAAGGPCIPEAGPVYDQVRLCGTHHLERADRQRSWRPPAAEGPDCRGEDGAGRQCGQSVRGGREGAEPGVEQNLRRMGRGGSDPAAAGADGDCRCGRDPDRL